MFFILQASPESEPAPAAAAPAPAAVVPNAPPARRSSHTTLGSLRYSIIYPRIRFSFYLEQDLHLSDTTDEED